MFRPHQIIAAVFRRPQHHVRGLQQRFRALIVPGGQVGNVRPDKQGVRVPAVEHGGERMIHALSEILTHLVAQTDAMPGRQRLKKRMVHPGRAGQEHVEPSQRPGAFHGVHDQTSMQARRLIGKQGRAHARLHGAGHRRLGKNNDRAFRRHRTSSRYGSRRRAAAPLAAVPAR